MNDLEDKQLVQINGGGITIARAIGIGTAIVFIVGIIDGFINPEKCN